MNNSMASPLHLFMLMLTENSLHLSGRKSIQIFQIMLTQFILFETVNLNTPQTLLVIYIYT